MASFVWVLLRNGKGPLDQSVDLSVENLQEYFLSSDKAMTNTYKDSFIALSYKLSEMDIT